MTRNKEYLVHYVEKNGKEGVYRSKWALCIDGAEEAARLDVKNIDKITLVEELLTTSEHG